MCVCVWVCTFFCAPGFPGTPGVEDRCNLKAARAVEEVAVVSLVFNDYRGLEQRRCGLVESFEESLRFRGSILSYG